jgi:hypothetical protein
VSSVIAGSERGVQAERSRAESSSSEIRIFTMASR